MTRTIQFDSNSINNFDLFIPPIQQLYTPLGDKDSQCLSSAVSAGQKKRVRCRECRKYRTAKKYGICWECLPKWKAGIARRKDRLGWIPEAYDDFVQRYGSECSVCGKPPKRARHILDYDRNTRQVEGLLCYSCFNGLRYFKFKFPRVTQAVEYLRVKYEAREERGDSYGYFE